VVAERCVDLEGRVNLCSFSAKPCRGSHFVIANSATGSLEPGRANVPSGIEVKDLYRQGFPDALRDQLISS
jgi:hypothetical protein